MFCSKCGIPNDDDAKFCVVCGESFEHYLSQENADNETENQKSDEVESENEVVLSSKQKIWKSILKIFVVVILVIATVIIGFKLWHKDGDNALQNAVMYVKDGEVYLIEMGQTKGTKIKDMNEDGEGYITKDGKTLYYITTDGNLVYAPLLNVSEYKKIDDNVEFFQVVNSDENIAYKKDGDLYFSEDVTKAGFKLLDEADFEKYVFYDSWSKIAFVNYDNVLCSMKIKNGGRTKKITKDFDSFALGITFYEDEDCFYYLKADEDSEKFDLYACDGKKTKKIAVDIANVGGLMGAWYSDRLFFVNENDNLSDDGRKKYSLYTVDKNNEKKLISDDVVHCSHGSKIVTVEKYG